MSTPLAQSFGQVLASLEAFMRDNESAPTPESEFVRYVYSTIEQSGPLPTTLPNLHPDSMKNAQAPLLAAVGYGFVKSAAGTLDELNTAWAKNLDRFSEKDAFPSDHQSFAFRPLEVLGLAVGTVARLPASSNGKAWLASVVGRLDKEGSSDFWARSLNATAAKILSVPWSDLHVPALSELQLEELALLRWQRDLLRKSNGGAKKSKDEIRDIDVELLRRVALGRVDPQDSARAAILFYAIRAAVSEHLETELERTWQIGREEQDALKIVESLSRRFHLFAKQLLTRHDSRATLAIADEYDVQDCMHALLRLHFEDVRPEEWTPSKGGKSTRMDFLLKREQVVVEVKMTRKNLGQKEVIIQLAEDKDRYRSHPDCKALFCFVYDPEGFCDNPNALEDDLTENAGELRVVVVVSPKGT